MFLSVGRRLALLNAAVLVAVLAIVGLSTYLFLDRRIVAEVDRELERRAEATSQMWATDFAPGSGEGAVVPTTLSSRSASPGDDESKHDDDDKHKEDDYTKEIIRSGETIAYGFDRTGAQIADLRQIKVDGLPDLALVQRALAGETTVATRTIDGKPIRLRTEPVLVNGTVSGALQVGMGLGPNHELLRYIRYASLSGLILGVLIAIPSGFFLANRSMRPIQEAFERQRAFVADAAHELRTPLALVRAQAEFLHSDDQLPKDEQRAGEELIMSEVDNMSRLVSNLLLLARADNSALALDRRVFDLHEIAIQQVERYVVQASDRGLILQVIEGAPVKVNADQSAIEQAIGILLSNAIAYTPSGGAISVRTDQRGRSAIVEVIDTGIGIAPADLERVFDRFYRADPARARASGGEGLGLAIAKALVEAHEGTITAVSQPGKGSTFTIAIPAEGRARPAAA